MRESGSQQQSHLDTNQTVNKGSKLDIIEEDKREYSPQMTEMSKWKHIDARDQGGQRTPYMKYATQIPVVFD